MPLSDYYPEMKDWTPVVAPSQAPPLPQLPTPEVQVSPFLRTALPLPLMYTPDTLKQSNRPGLSSYRVAPQSPNGFPAINSAATSAVSAAIAQAVIPVSAGMTSVGLTAPKEAVISNSPLVPPGGNIVWAWAAENPGFVFQAPPPGLGAYEGSSYATFLSHIGGGTMTVSQTPTTATSFGLIGTNGGTNLGIPAGWTVVSNTFSNFGFKAITGTTPVVASFAMASQIDGEVFLSLFQGPAPAKIQATGSNTASGTLAFASNNTAGNLLIVYLSAAEFSPAGPISITMSDTNGNRYQQIVNQDFVGNTTGTRDDFVQAVFICSGCAGGANSVNWAITGAGTGTLNSPTIVISEFGPLPTGNSIPFFAPVSGALIPAINLASTGNGGIGGILNVANGGTGDANLLAHGVLIGEGTAPVAVAAVGTKGQVLASNGPGLDPTMQGAVMGVSITSLSSAQILALQTTPITIVAAPGVQTTIVPISISIIFFGGTVAYTDAGGAVSFNIGSATLALASNAIFTTAASPNKQIQRVAGFPATDTSGNPPTDENAAMTISKATNNFAAGNGTAKIVVHYLIMPTV